MQYKASIESLLRLPVHFFTGKEIHMWNNPTQGFLKDEQTSNNCLQMKSQHQSLWNNVKVDQNLHNRGKKLKSISFAHAVVSKGKAA